MAIREPLLSYELKARPMDFCKLYATDQGPLPNSSNFFVNPPGGCAFTRASSGPSSQLSGPIAGFPACVEDAQRLRLPSAPFHRRGPTGLHRTQFRNPNRKSRKRETKTKIRGQMLSFARDEVGTANCMILLALIPVMNYNA